MFLSPSRASKPGAPLPSLQGPGRRGRRASWLSVAARQRRHRHRRLGSASGRQAFDAHSSTGPRCHGGWGPPRYWCRGRRTDQRDRKGGVRRGSRVSSRTQGNGEGAASRRGKDDVFHPHGGIKPPTTRHTPGQNVCQGGEGGRGWPPVASAVASAARPWPAPRQAETRTEAARGTKPGEGRLEGAVLLKCLR